VGRGSPLALGPGIHHPDPRGQRERRRGAFFWGLKGGRSLVVREKREERTIKDENLNCLLPFFSFFFFIYIINTFLGRDVRE